MIYIISGIIVFLVIISFSPDPKKKKSVKNKELPTVYQLVEKVNTVQDYKKFLREFDKIENKYQNSESEFIEKKYRIYDDAFGQVGNKTLKYQFIPDAHEFMTKEELEIGYKVFEIEEYERLKSKDNLNKNYWFEISAEDCLDKEFEVKDDEFKFFEKYFKIKNNPDLTNSEKETKIKNLIKRNKEYEYLIN